MENSTKEKILLLLLGGLEFAYSYGPNRQWRVLQKISRKWKKINTHALHKEINYFYKIKVINKEKNDDGLVSIIFTEKGKLRALYFQLTNIKNKKIIWDGKWRMVAFDMPEKFKKGRDALRRTLKSVGFHELQKSVFICPYDCLKEIDALVSFFKLHEYVRRGILEFIDNEDHFKKVFKLH